jgi:hypothetical protein
VLDSHLELSYYQGFHDVASTVLLVCKKSDVSRCVLSRLVTGPLRPLLATDLAMVTGLLSQLFPIVREEDATLHSFLVAAGVQPFFALPWVLTWFSHSVSSFAVVQRLFDLFLASDDPTLCFFLCVAIVLWSRPHLASVECEYSAVHSFYSKLFADIPLSLNLEPSDPRHSTRLAALIERDLELLLLRARLLAAKHGPTLRHVSNPARAFIETATAHLWSSLPPVLLTKVPVQSKEIAAELRYRFEGALSKRRRQTATRHARRALVVAVCVLLVAVWVRRFLL